MTIICALSSKDGDTIAFAGDRHLSYGQRTSIMHTPKWVDIDGIWIGVAGRLIFAQALKEIKKEEWLNVVKSPVAFRKLMHDNLIQNGGATPLKDNEDYFPVSGIIIIPGHGMWHFNGDLMPVPVKAGDFVATGSGEEYAYGAAYAHMLPNNNCDIYGTVLVATLAAAKHDMNCAQPIDVFTINSELKVSHHEHT